MRRHDGRNLITTGDRLPDTTRACQSGSRASSSGGMTRLGVVAVAEGAAQPGDVFEGGGVVDAGQEDLRAGGGPHGGRAVLAVLVAQLPGGVHHGGNLDALAGRVGQPGGQVDRAQVQLIEREQQPGVQPAVRLGQAVVAGGAVDVGGEAAEQRRARGAVPAGGEHVDRAAGVGERADVERPRRPGR